jgi:uncharacterized repeat protein (TIGR03803 family)
MQRKNLLRFVGCAVLMGIALTLMLVSTAVATTYKVLHRFTLTDGANPVSGLVLDATGNLYGTTLGGGEGLNGTVFKLSPNSDGTWTETILHPFTSGPDPGNPHGDLIFDGAGNLYGTTEASVYKLTPLSQGAWSESLLQLGLGGSFAGLIFDAAGNLYGTTEQGGVGYGTVFKLTPNSDGSWTQDVLHTFSVLDGAYVDAALIFDNVGNLYGTATQGGTDVQCLGCGVVFKLSPQPDGSWTETLLHSFNVADGATPYAGLSADVAGDLYGTTFNGGNSTNCPAASFAGCGVVFKLTRNLNGSWSYKVLHRFIDRPAAHPYAGVVIDQAGNLYGTTVEGGSANGGTVYKLSRTVNAGWTFTVLHIFPGTPALHPYGKLVIDSAGHLYGTARDCSSSSNCYGVVFEIIQ